MYGGSGVSKDIGTECCEQKIYIASYGTTKLQYLNRHVRHKRVKRVEAIEDSVELNQICYLRGADHADHLSNVDENELHETRNISFLRIHVALLSVHVYVKHDSSILSIAIGVCTRKKKKFMHFHPSLKIGDGFEELLNHLKMPLITCAP